MTHSYAILLEAFQNLNSDKWIDRKELAKIIGRPGWTLQHHDRQAIKQLISEGVIEARREKATGYGSKIWEYRRVTK